MLEIHYTFHKVLPTMRQRWRPGLSCATSFERMPCAGRHVVSPSCASSCLVLPDPQVGLTISSMQGILLLIIALGFQLPFASHFGVQALALAVYSGATKERCARECAFPHIQEFYQRLADGMGTVLAQAVPTVVASRRNARFIGVDACLLVQSWGQIVLGGILPTLIIDWFGKARSTLGGSPGRQPWAQGKQSSLEVLRVIVLYLGLLALASVVGWMGVELALAVWQQKLALWTTALVWRDTAEAGGPAEAVLDAHF